jgi:prevent-host-death family protein
MITTLRESKAKLSELVDRASRGEEVIITVRGKPKARLCPVKQPGAGERRRAGKWERLLREARESYSTGVHDSATEILDDVRGR